MRLLSFSQNTLWVSFDINTTFVHEVWYFSLWRWRLYGSYLSSERVLVRPAGRWGPLRSLPPELKGASWEVRECGELCSERERSGRGCCCSSDADPHAGYCRWRPEAHLGSWGLSSRTHMGTSISCTYEENTHRHTYINMASISIILRLQILSIFILV